MLLTCCYLKILSDAAEITNRKRGKLHEVYEDSFDIKECLTQKFLKQKLDSIHNNPCSGKWMLANCPEKYLHSSAKYYTVSRGFARLLIPGIDGY
jgi:hypothetical protein